MTLDEFQAAQPRTECSQNQAFNRLQGKGMRLCDPQMMGATHSVVGLAGEVGELASAVEKWVWYGRELDKVNVIEEVGDLMWRLAQLANALGFSMQDAIEANQRKLAVRYPSFFTQVDEQGRNKEAERAAINLPTEPGIPDASDC